MANEPLRWVLTGFPTEPGHYVVAPQSGGMPKRLSWSEQSKDWRDGVHLFRARAWYGPLPELPPRIEDEIE